MQKRLKETEFMHDFELIIYNHGVHMLLPECIPGFGILRRIMFKDSRKYPKQCKASSLTLKQRIELALKNWE